MDREPHEPTEDRRSDVWHEQERARLKKRGFTDDEIRQYLLKAAHEEKAERAAPSQAQPNNLRTHVGREKERVRLRRLGLSKEDIQKALFLFPYRTEGESK